MAHLRQRKNSDPENFTRGGVAGDNSGNRRGGGRAAGRAIDGGRGGRAAGRAIDGGRGGNNNAPGDTYVDMEIIEEEVEQMEQSAEGVDDKGNEREKKKKKKKNRADDNTNVNVGWMRTENNRNYIWMSYLLGIMATYSSVMAPLTCAFNVEEYLPYQIVIVIEFAFLADILREWIYANQSIPNDGLFPHLCYRIWLLNPRKLEAVAVAVVPLANLFQWKHLMWIKVVRAMRGKELLEKLEKVGCFNYAFILFVKIIAIQLYSIHTTGCMFYQLTTASEGLLQIHQTWMSDIQVDGQNLSGLSNVQKYIASTYFATVTLSTVGYGDIHATNLSEMITLSCFIIMSLTVWTYLGVQLANLFGRRSKKQIVEEKIYNLERYLKEAKIDENLAEDIIGHMQIKYIDDYDKKILEDVPPYLIAKINKNSSESIIRSVSLFKGCSHEFFKHLASGARQDFHPTGFTILEQGNIIGQLHILYAGGLEILQGGTVDPRLTRPISIFGLESFFLNEPLPHSIRTYKGSKFLIISKKYFMECLDNYPRDGETMMRNLSRGTNPDFSKKLLRSEFGIEMQRDVIRKASLLNCAIYFGDLEKVKNLINSGVSMDSADYNDEKPLDFAIKSGNTEIVNFLLNFGAERNPTGREQEHAD